MSWGAVAGAAVSVVGKSVFGAGEASGGGDTAAYTGAMAEDRAASKATETAARGKADVAWLKSDEAAGKGQKYYDAAGQLSTEELDKWRTEGLPILKELGLSKLDATDRTPEEEAKAANLVKTAYATNRESGQRAMDFARNPGDPGYADTMNANYGREAADVASAITNARATERERLQAVNTENFNRGKQVYDLYGNLLTSGRQDLAAAAGGTQRTAGLFANEAGAQENVANAAATRGTQALTAGYNANMAQNDRQDAADARWGSVAGKIGSGLVDAWKGGAFDWGSSGGAGVGVPENSRGSVTGPMDQGLADGGAIVNTRAQANRDTAQGTFDDQDRVTVQRAAPAGNTQPNNQPFSRAPSTPAQQGQLESMLRKRGDAAKYGYADGGEIEGPGTGTSDSISAIKKPGTYILSADTVRALGHKKLEDLMEKAGVKKSYGGGGDDESGAHVRLSNGEWSMPPEVTKYHGEEFFNKLQQKYHRPVLGGDEGMANGGAIRKRKLPMDVENAIFAHMPNRAISRRY